MPPPPPPRACVMRALAFLMASSMTMNMNMPCAKVRTTHPPLRRTHTCVMSMLAFLMAVSIRRPMLSGRYTQPAMKEALPASSSTTISTKSTQGPCRERVAQGGDEGRAGKQHDMRHHAYKQSYVCVITLQALHDVPAQPARLLLPPLLLQPGLLMAHCHRLMWSVD